MRRDLAVPVAAPAVEPDLRGRRLRLSAPDELPDRVENVLGDGEKAFVHIKLTFCVQPCGCFSLAIEPAVEGFCGNATLRHMLVPS